MAVQVVQTINEGSTAYLTVEFLDKAGEAMAPVSASYRIDCVTTGQEIRDDTALAPAASIEIKLAPADNVIVNAAHSAERRLVTVHASFALDDAVNEEYEYRVRNLRKFPSPVP